jgi:hypothetical protein
MRDKKRIQYLFRKRERKIQSENLGVDGKIILEQILGNRMGSCGLWLRIGTSAGNL